DQARPYVVRQVGDERPGTVGEPGTEVDLRGIDEQQLDIETLRDLLEERSQTFVHLVGHDPGTCFAESRGQRSGPGSDLHHQVPGSETGGGHDPAGHIRICQEVLSQTMLRPQPVTIEQRGDLGPRLAHDRNTLSALAVVMRATSSTGKSHTPASASPTRATQAG